MKITAVDITVVEIPQTAIIAPYRSHLRSSSATRSAIVRLETDADLIGWGEFNVNFLGGISAPRLQAEAAAWLLGRDALDVAGFHRPCPLGVRLKSGIEMAMWDLRGKATGQSVAMLLGGVLRPRVERAACMGIQSYERAGELAAYYVEQGFSTLKTKAGADREEDVAMVRGVRDAVGDRIKLRIDPNCAYTPQQALERARRLEEYDLEDLEQPILAEPLTDAAWLRRQTRTPIALNESVSNPSSVWQILRRGRGLHFVRYTAGGRYFAVRENRAPVRSGRHTLHHALRPRPGAQDGRDGACRRGLSGL